MRPANDNDVCRSCMSGRLKWEPDNGWITRPVRYLRCQQCGDCVRTKVPRWVWVMYGIALVAVGWALVSVML